MGWDGGWRESDTSDQTSHVIVDVMCVLHLVCVSVFGDVWCCCVLELERSVYVCVFVRVCIYLCVIFFPPRSYIKWASVVLPSSRCVISVHRIV